MNNLTTRDCNKYPYKQKEDTTASIIIDELILKYTTEKPKTPKELKEESEAQHEIILIINKYLRNHNTNP